MMALRAEPTDAPECDPKLRALLIAMRQGLIIMTRAIEAYLGIAPPRSER